MPNFYKNVEQVDRLCEAYTKRITFEAHDRELSAVEDEQFDKFNDFRVMAKMLLTSEKPDWMELEKLRWRVERLILERNLNE